MIHGATYNPKGGQRNRQFDYDPATATDALFSIVPPEDRNQWIQLAMSAKRAGVKFDDFNEWSHQGQNYGGERACRADWNAITEDGSITEATLYKTARDGGWRPSPTSIAPPPTNTPIRLTKPAMVTSPATNAKAQEVWDLCIAAEPFHPYIVRKHGDVHGTRCYPESAPALVIQGQNVAGCLVVPCWSEGHLQTLQFIPPHGKKLNLPGATFSDGYHVIGTIAPGDTVYVGEGRAKQPPGL